MGQILCHANKTMAAFIILCSGCGVVDMCIMYFEQFVTPLF